MAERRGETAARLAFADLVDALARYLYAKGWEDVDISLDPARAAIDCLTEGAYAFVVPFTAPPHALDDDPEDPAA